MVYVPPQHKAQVLPNNNNESFIFFTDETKMRSRKKSVISFISLTWSLYQLQQTGKVLNRVRNKRADRLQALLQWKQTDLHVCVDAGSDISVFTLLRLTHSCLR